jgi:hypothetical protein
MLEDYGTFLGFGLRSYGLEYALSFGLRLSFVCFLSLYLDVRSERKCRVTLT